MNINQLFIAGVCSCLSLSTLSRAEDMVLPKPVVTGGMSLNDALMNRRTERDLSDKALTDQQISNLLWAASGINRPDLGKRTVPTALNKQELELYVLLPSGVYTYDAKGNTLKQISTENLLDASGAFGMAEIVIVYDTTKNTEQYAYTDSGFIGQNVYLFCAANKMGACFKGSVKPLVAEKLKLPDNKRALYTMSVGLLNE